MAAILNLKNPIDVREAGLKALNAALGYDGARAFIDQYEGVGDFTSEKYDRPEPSFEELTERLKRYSVASVL